MSRANFALVSSSLFEFVGDEVPEELDVLGTGGVGLVSVLVSLVDRG